MKSKFDKPIPPRLYAWVLGELSCIEDRIKAIQDIFYNDDTFYFPSVEVETSEARAGFEAIQKRIDSYLKHKAAAERGKHLSNA